MFQKDYIMRLTEEIARVMAALAGMPLPADRIETVRAAFRKELQTEPDLLRRTSAAELLQTLQAQPRFSAERAGFMAELLYVEGKAELELDNPETAKDLLCKAKQLFDYADAEQQLFSFGRAEKVAEIESLLLD